MLFLTNVYELHMYAKLRHQKGTTVSSMLNLRLELGCRLATCKGEEKHATDTLVHSIK